MLATLAWAGACGSAAVRADLPTDRFAELAAQATAAEGSFRAPDDAALSAAAAGLRDALRPLAALLGRSKSGADWKTYLDWPALEAQAAGGQAADPAVLRGLEERLGATETGLDMPEFVRVRKAVTRYAEAADAARGQGAQRATQRLKSLAAALEAAAKTGSTESLAPVPQTLERLDDAGQAGPLVRSVRGALARPNMLFEVHERLFAQAVDRPIDQSMPINEVLLGTRVRGTGHTTGLVRLDFVPSHDRAALDLVMSARNLSSTRGSKGPVTVHTSGVTDLSARRRIWISEHSVSASPVSASASTSTHVDGLGISSRFGKKFIRKMANRKIAETKPQAEAIAQSRARARVHAEFARQTDPAIAQFREQFQSRVRGPLQARGLYPEMFHIASSDEALMVTARKALPTQLAAPSAPPPPAGADVLAVRLHESAVNNVFEQKLGGRRVTQADVETLAADFKAQMPESLENEADQQPWEVTFAKYRPISLSVADQRMKIMVRGDKFVSGDRDFPGMDIWATYAIGRGPQGIMLVREGDVQIYPPGFTPGGADKLSPAETSLRRILQRRFDKVFKAEIEIPDLELQGELAAAGPLPLNELVARKDGWIVAGWREKDRVISVTESAPAPAATVVVR